MIQINGHQRDGAPANPKGHEAFVGELQTFYPAPTAITERPEGSAAELDGATFTPDVPGWYVLQIGPETLRLCAFEPECLDLIPVHTTGMARPRTDLERRRVLRSVAAYSVVHGGTVADLSGIDLRAHGA